MLRQMFAGTMMKKCILILFVSSAISLLAYAQEPKNVPPQDSSAGRTQAIDARSLYPYGVLSLRPSLDTGPQSFPEFLHQSLDLSPSSFSWEPQQHLSIASAWKSELLKQEEYKTLKTILGSIQMGGAAYLAYRHIKKYGLK